ncbi:MAG: hypothetical protein K0S12_1406 [Bacteroidetes bacterium]|nr:hypothetical protein [Bacteroidota bacterium]
MNALLSSAYWPNLHYFYYVLNSETVYIESCENYQKQSFRNRTQILSANGKLDLVIPVKRQKEKESIATLEISHAENWRVKHWRAITSAYKNSPYFEYFEEEIAGFYTKEYDLLLDYNTQQLKTLLRLLKIKKEIVMTADYIKTPLLQKDVREIIHPKIVFEKDENVKGPLARPYYQTFEIKFGFTPNLSVLDLLFNKGLQTLDYFPKDTLTL